MTRAFLPDWLDYNKSKWRTQREARMLSGVAPFNPHYVAPVSINHVGDGDNSGTRSQRKAPLVDWRSQLGIEPRLTGPTYVQWLRYASFSFVFRANTHALCFTLSCTHTRAQTYAPHAHSLSSHACTPHANEMMRRLYCTFHISVMQDLPLLFFDIRQCHVLWLMLV